MTHFQLSTMSQIDFTRAHLHVRRLKGGIASVHPIQGDELRALRELRRQTEGARPIRQAVHRHHSCPLAVASPRWRSGTVAELSKVIDG
jgi:hypothetical protein